MNILKDILKKLMRLLDKSEKKRYLMLFFMMLIAAVLETIGIGLIVPFISLVTNPEVILEQSTLTSIYNFFNFNSSTDFIVFTAALLLLVFVIKNLYLFVFNYLQIRFTYNQQVKYSRDLLKAYLGKPFTFHL